MTVSGKGAARHPVARVATVVLCLLAMVAALFVAGAGTAYADDKKSCQDDKSNGICNTSFADLTSSLSQAYSNYLAYNTTNGGSTTEIFGTGSDQLNDVGNTNKPLDPNVMDDGDRASGAFMLENAGPYYPGGAGSLLGYANMSSSLWGNLAGKVSSYFNINTAVNSSQYSYADLYNKGQNGAAAFVAYGSAVKVLGLDANDEQNHIANIGRALTGVIAILFFGAANLATKFMYFAVLALQWFNPFRLFYGGVSKCDSVDSAGNCQSGTDAANSMVGSNSGPSTSDPGSALNGVADIVTDLYTNIRGIGWVVLVVMLGIVVALLLLHSPSKQGRDKVALKHVVIAIVFSLIGLPLLGGMYTGVLGKLGSKTSDDSAQTTVRVMATYVDTQHWLVNSAGALPDSLAIDTARDNTQATTDAEGQFSPSLSALVNGRYFAYKINMATQDTQGSCSIDETQAITIGSYKYYPLSSFGNTYTYHPSASGDPTKNASQKSCITTASALKLLRTYSSQDTVDGSAIESAYKSSHSIDLATKDEPADPTDGSSNEDAYKWALYQVQKGYGGKWFAGNSNNYKAAIKAAGSKTGLWYSSGAMTASKIGATSVTIDKSSSTSCDWKGASCNMTPLAMYNYLQADFNGGTMTVYSTATSSSDTVLHPHWAATQLGTGILKPAYYLDLVVALGCIAILSFAYGIGMIIGSIKRAIQLLQSVPFAVLGAWKSILRVITVGLAMTFEIILDIVLYIIAMFLIENIGTVVEEPLVSWALTGANDTWTPASIGIGAFSVSTSGTAVIAVSLFVGMALEIFATKLCIKMRSAIAKEMDQVADSIVQRVFGDSGGTPSTPSMGGNPLASGLKGAAAAAGDAAGGKAAAGKAMAAKAGGKNPVSGAKAAGGAKGGAGVKPAGPGHGKAGAAGAAGAMGALGAMGAASAGADGSAGAAGKATAEGRGAAGGAGGTARNAKSGGDAQGAAKHSPANAAGASDTRRGEAGKSGDTKGAAGDAKGKSGETGKGGDTKGTSGDIKDVRPMEASGGANDADGFGANGADGMGFDGSDGMGANGADGADGGTFDVRAMDDSVDAVNASDDSYGAMGADGATDVPNGAYGSMDASDGAYGATDASYAADAASEAVRDAADVADTGMDEGLPAASVETDDGGSYSAGGYSSSAGGDPIAAAAASAGAAVRNGARAARDSSQARKADKAVRAAAFDAGNASRSGGAKSPGQAGGTARQSMPRQSMPRTEQPRQATQHQMTQRQSMQRQSTPQRTEPQRQSAQRRSQQPRQSVQRQSAQRTEPQRQTTQRQTTQRRSQQPRRTDTPQPHRRRTDRA